MISDRRSITNQRTAWKLAVLVLAMFGFGYALVPLYDVFCQITGLNGKTGRVEAAALDQAVDTSRRVTVEFIAAVNAGASFEFAPSVHRMTVHPGQVYETTYWAKNLAPRDRVGQAVPSVAPNEASLHFNKTECFCFTQQRFEAEQSREMPVRFVISKDLPERIKTVTLSYTFFDVRSGG